MHHTVIVPDAMLDTTDNTNTGPMPSRRLYSLRIGGK